MKFTWHYESSMESLIPGLAGQIGKMGQVQNQNMALMVAKKAMTVRKTMTVRKMITMTKVIMVARVMTVRKVMMVTKVMTVVLVNQEVTPAVMIVRVVSTKTHLICIIYST